MLADTSRSERCILAASILRPIPVLIAAGIMASPLRRIPGLPGLLVSTSRAMPPSSLSTRPNRSPDEPAAVFVAELSGTQASAPDCEAGVAIRSFYYLRNPDAADRSVHDARQTKAKTFTNVASSHMPVHANMQ